MANTQKANPADRFRLPPSVTKWHMTRRFLRGRRPEGEETADSLPQAFRLDVAKPPAGDKPRAPQGGKANP
jgi:hypothetical protein